MWVRNFYREYIFCDSLFVFLQIKPLLKLGLLYMERFFSFKVDPLQEDRQNNIEL